MICVDDHQMADSISEIKLPKIKEYLFLYTLQVKYIAEFGIIWYMYL